jgi:hypothetical protein
MGPIRGGYLRPFKENPRFREFSTHGLLKKSEKQGFFAIRRLTQQQQLFTG